MDYTMSKILFQLNNCTMGEKIKFLRERKKLSLQNLADETGIAKGTLSNIENGKNCNLSNIIDLADFFDVSIDWLLSRSQVSDTEYDLNFVCDYTGLSEEAVTALKKQHEHLDIWKRSKLSGTTDIDVILNTVISSRLAFDIASNTALYKEAITKGISEYNTLIRNLEDSTSIEDHIKWITENGFTDIEKELIYNLFYSQEEVKDYMKDYAKEERQALEDKRNQYKELSKQKEEGEKDGNNQETQ